MQLSLNTYLPIYLPMAKKIIAISFKLLEFVKIIDKNPKNLKIKNRQLHIKPLSTQYITYIKIKISQNS